MKTNSESPQQARKVPNPIVQPTKQLILTYPLKATEDEIRQSIKYYIDVTNERLKNTGNMLRVSLGTVTISLEKTLQKASVTGPQIDWIMKGGVPNPPPNPPPPIIPADSLTYDSTQLIRIIQGNVAIYQEVTIKTELSAYPKIASHLNTKQGEQI